MKKKPNFLLSREQVDILLPSGNRDWNNVNVIPCNHWSGLPDFFSKDKTRAIVSSGIHPHQNTGSAKHIISIARFRWETNPTPGEPPINVDYFLVEMPTGTHCPTYGPISSGGGPSHWCTIEEYRQYMKQIQTHKFHEL